MSRRAVKILFGVLAILISLGVATGFAQDVQIWFGPPPWEWNEGISETGELV